MTLLKPVLQSNILLGGGGGTQKLNVIYFKFWKFFFWNKRTHLSWDFFQLLETNPLKYWLHEFLCFYLQLFLTPFYICTLLVCLFVFRGWCPFVSNKHQNDWTDRAQFFLWDLAWPQERFIESSNFQKLASIKFFFEKFENPQFFFIKSAKFLFRFCFTMYTKRTHSQWKWKMGAKRSSSLVYNNV